jgi:hypothetical protein
MEGKVVIIDVLSDGGGVGMETIPTTTKTCGFFTILIILAGKPAWIQ